MMLCHVYIFGNHYTSDDYIKFNYTCHTCHTKHTCIISNTVIHSKIPLKALMRLLSLMSFSCIYPLKQLVFTFTELVALNFFYFTC